MKIALILGGIRFDSQSRIIQGIMERVVRDQADLYIFTCDAWTYSATQYSRGEMSILSLPDFTSFDGIVIHGDTIYNDDVMQKLVNRIREAGTVCVSLILSYEGMITLNMENANGITRIVNHLIRDHGAKRLNFISGPKGNHDGEGRLAAFRGVLAENNIELDENQVYYGDYHPDSGKDAVNYFWSTNEEVPDAIVAANDEMALGAFYGLQEQGLSVPEDVMLTGYDYAFAGRNHYPKITSVKRPEHELGRRAYDKILNTLQGKQVEKYEELLCWPVYTESCGCKDEVFEDEKEFRKQVVREKMSATTFSEIIKSSSADFTGAVDLPELFDCIRKYLRMIDPKEFYFCLCSIERPFNSEVMSKINTETLPEDISQYTEEVYIPIVYRDRTFSEYGKFPAKQILPEVYSRTSRGVMYTVVPMHYQERTFGYCVLGNSTLMMDSDWFHLFIMNINNALEEIRKQAVLNNMVERLNRMWVYDTLTGIYNRAGFFKFAPAVISEAMEKKEPLFVLFLDLDGLKKVNDKYGHDEGDSYIKAIANILSKVRKHGEILMRYGGDEFVILSYGYNVESAQAYVAQIKTGIENYNICSAHEYTLSASMGYTIMEASENLDIEEVIEMADIEMYKDKNTKRK